MKSVSGAKKRFRFSGRGKARFKKAYHSHIMTHKTTKKKRKQRQTTTVASSDQKRVKLMLPYGG
jgi:large subunit ribosomal protein L35